MIQLSFGTTFSLLEAIADRRVCRVDYQSPWRTEPRSYHVAPLAPMAHHATDHATLYARCCLVTEKGEPEVISWVLSFGPEASVLGPEDLRE